MKRLLIVFHAPSPNTERLLAAMQRGAGDEVFAGSVEAIAKPALEAGPDDVLACDAILLFTPENLGYMSGAMKDFFDRSYYALLEEKQGLPCTIVIRAGHDGTGTRRAMESILTGLRWRITQEPLVLRGDWNESFVTQAGEAAMTLSAALDAGIL